MKIISKEILADVHGSKINALRVLAPAIAKAARPGQFVVVMPLEKSERIPLTIVDTDIEAGTITLIFQELGFTTRVLGKMKPGDSLYAIVGPLGHATEIKKYGKVVVVGGGVGIAEIYPVIRAFKSAGNYVATILGARTKDLLILEKGIKSMSDETYTTTDDGSYGRKGFTTDVLDELLKKDKYQLAYIVGPIPMMRKAAGVTKTYGVNTLVSLNALMVDATGMCGCCRVTVDGRTKFSCVDGPEFDGHKIDWDELTKRNKIYSDKEKHICELKDLF